MSELTFKNLVDLKADEWNSLVALEYNVNVEDLKDIIIQRDLRLLENNLQHNITREEIEDLADTQRDTDSLNADLFNDDSSIIYESTVIDKFVIRITDTENLIDSIAITGKIIIGANFSKSNLSSSYFCGCTFYRCNLTGVDFGNSVFISCDFIACEMPSCDFNGSTISRSHFYECTGNLTLDYTAFTDCMVVGCDFSSSTYIQSRVLFTGFSGSDLSNFDWKDSDIVQCTFTNCNCTDSYFKRSVLVDSILIRSSFTGCDFNSLSVTCLSMSSCKYDDKYKHFFEMEHLLYSPAIFEWDEWDGSDIPDDLTDPDAFDDEDENIW